VLVLANWLMVFWKVWIYWHFFLEFNQIRYYINCLQTA
jgi:hypothetical protein